MLPLIALACVALAGAAAAPAREDDPCVFSDTQELYPLGQFEDCAAQIPLDLEGVAYPTLDTMERLLDLFVFEEMAKKPIAPYDDPQNGYKLPAVDVRADLAEVRARVERGDISTDFEFHSALSAVFLPLKDPHTVYAKPSGYGPFFATLPVTFEARADPHDPAGVSLFLRALPAEKEAFTQRFAKSLEASGRDLFALLGRKILSINGRQPLEAVQAFADEVVYISKNPSSRFNSALQGDFFSRSLRKLNLPSGSANDPLSYTFGLEGGETLEVPLSITVSSEVTGRQQIEEQNAPASSGASRDAEASPAADTPLARFLRDNAPVARPSASAEPDSVEVIEGDTRYTFSLVHDGVDVRLHSLAGTPLNEEAKAGAYLAYVLSIVSFSPDEPAVFTEDFRACVEKVQAAYEAQPGWPLYLIVNVMGNGGGYITLGYRSLHALAPHVNPTYGNYTIRKSDLAHYFATNGDFSTQKRYDLPTWKELGPRDWYDDSQEVMTFPNGNQMEISKTYTFDLAYDEVVFEDAFLDLWDAPTPEFLKSGNTRIAFVTDGLCGSTCACFSKRAREARAGLFLGVGGNPNVYDSGNVPMDVASFAGGSVMDTQFVFSKDHAKDLSKRHDLEPLPTSAVFRWAFEQIFSWDAELEYSPTTTPLEYVNNPVDDYVDYWPGPGSEYSGIEHLARIAIKAYQKVSSKCYDFQVEPSESCAAQSPEGSHLTYGSACVRGEFTTEVCKFMECELGYVHNADGSCTLQPEKTMLPASSVEKAAYICLGVIAGVIIVGLVAFLSLKCAGCAKARRAAKTGAPRDGAPEEREKLVQEDKSGSDHSES